MCNVIHRPVLSAYPFFIFANWSLCSDCPLWLKSYSRRAIFQQCEFILLSCFLSVSSEHFTHTVGRLVRPRPSVKNSLHVAQINMKLRISVQKLMTRWLSVVMFRSLADCGRGSQITEIYNSLGSKEAPAPKIEGSVSPSAKAPSSPHSLIEPKTVTCKRKAPTSENEETDEQMARRLQGEYGGSRTRKQRSSRSARPAKKTRPKSHAHIDNETEKNGDKKDDTKTKRGGAFNKELLLRWVQFPYPCHTNLRTLCGLMDTKSDSLAELVGSHSLSRPQVVKHIWAYVKERNLQDSNDRRYILCDDKLREVFHTDRLHMFTWAISRYGTAPFWMTNWPIVQNEQDLGQSSTRSRWYCVNSKLWCDAAHACTVEGVMFRM